MPVSSYEKVFLKLVSGDKQEKLNINSVDIPTLSPEASIAEFSKGDTNPYYKIQKIDYPIVANEMNYGKKFFESYIENLKDRPIPGSKDGHNLQYGVRPKTDFIMVGAKIEPKTDKSGSVYFKNYIPAKAESDNSNFITECKSDMVHFSVVAYARKQIVKNEDGTSICNILDCGSQGLRNDAVSFGEGAMSQVTNQTRDVDVIDDEFICLEAVMPNKQEFLDSLKVHAGSGVTLPEIAKAMGQENLLATKEHEDALKMVNAIKEAGIKDPVAELVVLRNKIESDQKIVRNAALDTAFGADTNGRNTLRQYADEKIKKDCTDVNAAIEEIKKSPIALKLAEQAADYLSDQNQIYKVDSASDKTGVISVFEG